MHDKSEIRSLLAAVCEKEVYCQEVIRLCDERNVDCANTDAYLAVLREVLKEFAHVQ